LGLGDYKTLVNFTNGKPPLDRDKGIQDKWQKDIPGYIKKANANWSSIKDKAADAL